MNATDLQNHPQYTDADLAYLRGKGYSDDQIRAFWDRDLAQGKAPCTVNKHDPSTYPADHPLARG